MSTTQSPNGETVTKHRVGELLARRRENITDDFVTDFDYINERGQKIEKKKSPGPEGKNKEIEINLTALLQPAPSTTSSLEIIRIEAQLVDSGKEDINPHIPATDAVLEDAVEELDRHDLVPAWEVDE